MAKNNFSKIINFIAFIGLIMVAVVLVLQKILSGELIGALRTIGEAIAYFVTAVSAFFYVRSKRNVWWYIAYTVAIILVIIFMVLRAN